MTATCMGHGHAGAARVFWRLVWAKQVGKMQLWLHCCMQVSLAVADRALGVGVSGAGDGSMLFVGEERSSSWPCRGRRLTGSWVFVLVLFGPPLPGRWLASLVGHLIYKNKL